MRTGILYVSHGSRVAHNNEKVSRFTSEIYPLLGNEIPQQTAFLEGDEQTIKWGINDLAKKGVEKIIVIPLLLFTATHVNEDIPRALAESTKERPFLTFKIVSPLAEMPGIENILVRRICMHVHTKMTTLYFIAHGSAKYPEIPAKLHAICQKVEAQLGIKTKSAFLYGEKPYMEILQQEKGELLIYPFFLLDGLLVSKIEIAVHEKFPEATILPSLNLDDDLKDLIITEIRKEL